MPKTIEELEVANTVLQKQLDELSKNGKEFNQQQVDDMIQKRVAKTKDEHSKLVEQLDVFKQGKSLSETQQTELQETIANLESTLLTKEEIAAKEKTKADKKYNKDLEEALGDAKKWKQQYADASIVRAITDAAAEAEVCNVSQFVSMLRPSTRLVEVEDKLVPHAKIDSVNSEGKPVTLDLPVPEAIKQMKEMAEHANLFKGQSTGGTGSTTLQPGNAPGSIDMKDTEKYIEARLAGKLPLSKVPMTNG